ncbi:ADP-ribosyl cyclase/cyclic ADP-ribose hydrolase 1 [Orycteropus afer afer]|uniref:ADP-ribosyl cyclase/cyclic ADP-ribose hydrolase 1 n=1 Tax=Orycteropus afer afer TaxID=1230840 RepID=A0A8B7AK96_ORYAF|nr:ADP-ribosyl cyclase/cyclic ADP-ribose hydrolase 1 [Orycteropus afer afer]
MAPESSSRRHRRMRCCVLLGVSALVLGTVALMVGVLWWRQSSKPLEPLQWRGPGTTAHISEIVLGRCFSYMQEVQSELRDQDCQKIWNVFKNAFLTKNPCNITEEDYQPLVKLANQTLPCNKTLLWSRTNALAHQYTKVQQEIFTLEDTLLGSMADGLVWCGDAGTTEMNYQSCPNWKTDCRSNPVSVFWNTVSKKFAEAACGVVHVMLNGSISKAFDQNSVFGSVEILNLHPARVHSLQAWVMHDIGGVSRDSCSGSSISDLRSILSKKNIMFTCQDDYSVRTPM